MTLGRQTQCGLDSESPYRFFAINVLKEVTLICSTETCWSHFVISDRQCFHTEATLRGNWKPVGEGVGESEAKA